MQAVHRSRTIAIGIANLDALPRQCLMHVPCGKSIPLKCSSVRTWFYNPPYMCFLPGSDLGDKDDGLLQNMIEKISDGEPCIIMSVCLQATYTTSSTQPVQLQGYYGWSCHG